MQGLVVFLTILIGLFVIVAIVLVVMVIGLTRRISRVQENTKKVYSAYDKVSTLVSVASSLAALGLKARATLKKSTKRRRSND